MFGKLEFDGWVIEGGQFVVHGLHDFEPLREVVDAMLWSSEGGADRLKGVCGGVESRFLLNLVDAPCEVVHL